jgi:hypothetical protein
MADPTAYPLAWPPGWPRSRTPEQSKFRVTMPSALSGLKDELRRLGAKNVVISSNVTLGASRPKDTGVAVYFQYEGDATCIPCDRWNKVEDNVHAIAKTIEALRGIERWGAKHMIKAAFRGFEALPAPGARPWRDVLELRDQISVNRDHVEEAYRRLALERHPDKGGSEDMMAELNAARDQARKDVE